VLLRFRQWVQKRPETAQKVPHRRFAFVAYGSSRMN
jgi:hypothetical protein